jgi:hypothetical protein
VRSTPQLPLATPEANPEKIIRNGKAPREGASAAIPGDSGNFHNPSLNTPVVVSHFPVTLSSGASRILNFGSFLVFFSPSSLGLERFGTHVSPEFVPWLRPRALEDFPTPIFSTTPIKIASFKEGETYVPSSPVAFSPNI